MKSTGVEDAIPDPLTAAYRNSLKAGQVVTDFVSGVSMAKHMFATADGNSFVLQERTAKIVKQTRTIQITSFRTVSKGYGPGHYHKTLVRSLKTNAAEDKCLYVSSSSPNDEVTVEFANNHDRNKWFEILEALITAAHACPHVLHPL